MHRSLLIAIINLFRLRDTPCINESHLWVCLSISREDPWGNTESQLSTRIPRSLHLGLPNGPSHSRHPTFPCQDGQYSSELLEKTPKIFSCRLLFGWYLLTVMREVSKPASGSRYLSRPSAFPHKACAVQTHLKTTGPQALPVLWL